MNLRTAKSKLQRRIDSARLHRREAKKYSQYQHQEFRSSAELVDAHFRIWSDPGHFNRRGFELSLQTLDEAPAIIVETGTSAWGTDSSRLWDSYVNHFGGEFWTVDLSPRPSRRLRKQLGSSSHLVVDDSVNFLSNFVGLNPDTKVNICYLDSWDLDWSDPIPAAVHGLAEFEAIRPLLAPGSVLLVDDTPSSPDWVPEAQRQLAEEFLLRHNYMPGKGAFIHTELSSRPDVEVMWHGYNVVYRFL